MEAKLGGITNRSTGGYFPGMAGGEPTKTIGHARAGGEKALTCVYRKLDPDVLMMKSAENRM